MTLLIGLAAACGGAPPPSPRPCPPPPEVERAPPEVVVTPTAPAPEALPNGIYWVRRPRGEGISGMAAVASGAPDAPRERWRRGRTECVPLEVRGEGASRTLEVEAIRFTVRADAGALRLGDPALTSLSPPLASTEGCALPLRVEPSTIEGAIETSAGLLFREASRCDAERDAYEQRCAGDRCTFTEPAARPFALPSLAPLVGPAGPCSAAVRRLRAIAGRLAVTHEAARATYARWTAVTARGGRVWERRAGEPLCDAVRVEPRGDGEVRLRMRRAEEGGVLERVAEYRFEPLFRSAILLGRSSHYQSPDEAWATGSAGPRTLGLYLGDGVVAVGDRLLFLRARDCLEGLP